jgi:hypothetical protein
MPAQLGPRETLRHFETFRFSPDSTPSLPLLLPQSLSCAQSAVRVIARAVAAAVAVRVRVRRGRNRAELELADSDSDSDSRRT